MCLYFNFIKLNKSNFLAINYEEFLYIFILFFAVRRNYEFPFNRSKISGIFRIEAISLYFVLKSSAGIPK